MTIIGRIARWGISPRPSSQPPHGFTQTVLSKRLLQNLRAGQKRIANIRSTLRAYPKTVGDCPKFAESSEQIGTVPLRQTVFG